ncbi:M42 family metallopeptidase [Candidatus Micrarchaeota archaeon]|nr:M42 family metallopeptidase [Candidatus Micrarchaeota archaeon]
MTDVTQTLKTLSELHGPTGQEDAVADFLENQFKQCGFSVRRDVLGNVMASKGKGKKVMVAAHMDEISMSVKSITDKGFLKFVKIGGIYDPMLVGSRVMVHAPKPVLGVVAAKAPHQMDGEELKKIQEAKDLYIDVGASNKKEAEKLGIRVGTHITFVADFQTFSGDRVIGKALDDRAGCATLVLLAHAFAKKTPPVELHLVGTVREESGLFGAGVAAFGLEPDLAIAVDVTHAFGAPGASEEEVPVALGKGPALAVIEGGGYGLITSHKMVDWIDSVAKKQKVPLQMDVHERGATDASRMQYSRQGLLTASLGIPLRYMHSQSEIVDTKDVEQTAQLVEGMIHAFPDYK